MNLVDIDLKTGSAAVRKRWQALEKRYQVAIGLGSRCPKHLQWLSRTSNPPKSGFFISDRDAPDQFHLVWTWEQLDQWEDWINRADAGTQRHRAQLMAGMQQAASTLLVAAAFPDQPTP